jgi:uncharacterized protein YuzE
MDWTPGDIAAPFAMTPRGSQSSVMRTTFSPDDNTAYIYLTTPGDGHTVSHTEPLIVDLPSGSRALVNLDFDAQGHLIGIEVEGATATLPQNVLDAAERPGTLHRW